jgi:glycosyltransferase involved in cell wall biosynthesis
MGAAISALVSDSLRRQRMGEAGRDLASRNFSWDRIAEKMEEAYERCLAG